MDKSTDKLPLSPELEARVQRAVDNFMQGYGCCQSVVAAFADLYNLDDSMAKRIAAGFGGLDIVVDALPEPLHTIVKKFSRVLVLAYLAIFFCMSTRMVIENWTNRSSTMHLPMSVVYLAMVIGSAGMFIEELLLLLGKGGSEKLDAGDMGGGM